VASAFFAVITPSFTLEKRLVMAVVAAAGKVKRANGPRGLPAFYIPCFGTVFHNSNHVAPLSTSHSGTQHDKPGVTSEAHSLLDPTGGHSSQVGRGVGSMFRPLPSFNFFDPHTRLELGQRVRNLVDGGGLPGVGFSLSARRWGGGKGQGAGGQYRASTGHPPCEAASIFCTISVINK
jgi:hypothetical protein